jgi:hypothetical protein
MLHTIPILALSALLSAESVGASAADSGDLIGSIDGEKPFDDGRGVLIGKDSSGSPVCYFREIGDTHQLDIGIAVQGAFLRLETGEPPLSADRPSDPVAVYAGKEIAESGKATGRFTVLQRYAGQSLIHSFSSSTASFTLITPGDTKELLDVAGVAGTERQFVVIESIVNASAREYVGVVEFNTESARALQDCADRTLNTASSRTPRLAPKLPARLW